MTPDDDYLAAISSMGFFNDDSTWLPEECDPDWAYSTGKIGMDSTTHVPSYECFLPWTNEPSAPTEINDSQATATQSQNTNTIQLETQEDNIENILAADLEFANGLLDPEKNPGLSVEIDSFLQALAKSDDLNGIRGNEEPLLVQVPEVTTAACHGQSEPQPAVATSATKRHRRGRRSNANSSNEQFKCYYENCGRVYPKSSHLKMHLRRHTGEKPFHCPWEGCTWRFSRSDELNRHHRSHTGDKPYHCAICNKKFGRSDHLAKHKRVHERSAGQGYEILLPFGQPSQLPTHPEPPKRGRPRKDAVRYLASRVSRPSDSTLPQPIMPRPYSIMA